MNTISKSGIGKEPSGKLPPAVRGRRSGARYGATFATVVTIVAAALVGYAGFAYADLAIDEKVPKAMRIILVFSTGSTNNVPQLTITKFNIDITIDEKVPQAEEVILHFDMCSAKVPQAERIILHYDMGSAIDEKVPQTEEIILPYDIYDRCSAVVEDNAPKAEGIVLCFHEWPLDRDTLNHILEKVQSYDLEKSGESPLSKCIYFEWEDPRGYPYPTCLDFTIDLYVGPKLEYCELLPGYSYLTRRTGG